MEKKTEKKYTLIMVLAAFLWGTTFAAQRISARYIGAFTWVAFRALAAAALLCPVIAIMRRLGYSERTADRKKLTKAGLVCGFVLFFATFTQQIGMVNDTGAGKAGFITALYIVLVPLIRMLRGKRVSGKIWFSVALATAGLYLLSVTDGFTIGRGDLWLLACALFFSFHILAVDRYAADVESLALCRLQFLVSGALALVCALVMEKPTMEQLIQSFWPNMYAAFFSGCIAYSAQIIGQRKMEPTRASLVMCLESVFSFLAGCVVLGERFSIRELSGCVLMFAAIVLCTLISERKEQA